MSGEVKNDERLVFRRKIRVMMGLTPYFLCFAFVRHPDGAQVRFTAAAGLYLSE
ncbi:hypothetical protein CXB74_011235 [Morganella morganii]|uniref:hypothetical protein n=1 Tax=Morganella morganii TaxID=582 RepID=UPI001C7725A7|nr:hypothetical protein [Morganella morganii]QXO41264.1 hypothetical protein CXB74_011235 [Morganella morganii]